MKALISLPLNFAVAALLIGNGLSNAFGQSITEITPRIPSQSQIEDMQNQGLGAAPPSEARPMHLLALSLLKYFEGWSSVAYDDPAGYCTVGYGHLIAKKKCSQIVLGNLERLSEQEGATLLEMDTRSARYAVQQLVSIALTDDQFGALSSFVFNVGARNFSRSTLLFLINSNHISAASSEFHRWVKADGKIFQGLIDRRSCEAALFMGALKFDVQGKFNRQQCTALGAAPPSGDLVDIGTGEP